MANPTTNFGWQMPQNTDLVKDLPADFEVFGQAVDTDLADLKGGTTGQVLSKTSNTDLDFTWVTPTDQTPLTTKGDLFTFTTVDARLGVGANGTVLTADSTEATGLKWAAASGGSLTISQIATGTLSGTSTTLASSLTSYDFLMIVVTGFVSASNSNYYLTLNNNTADNYSYVYNIQAGTTVTQTGYDTTTEGFTVTYWDQSAASNTSNQVIFTLQNCKSAGFTTMTKHSRYIISGPTNVTEAGQGVARFSAAVSSLELKSGASATGGTFYVFGG